jgi:hypothetical protein
MNDIQEIQPIGVGRRYVTGCIRHATLGPNNVVVVARCRHPPNSLVAPSFVVWTADKRTSPDKSYPATSEIVTPRGEVEAGRDPSCNNQSSLNCGSYLASPPTAKTPSTGIILEEENFRVLREPVIRRPFAAGRLSSTVLHLYGGGTS